MQTEMVLENKEKQSDDMNDFQFDQNHIYDIKDITVHVNKLKIFSDHLVAKHEFNTLRLKRLDALIEFKIKELDEM